MLEAMLDSEEKDDSERPRSLSLFSSMDSPSELIQTVHQVWGNLWGSGVRPLICVAGGQGLRSPIPVLGPLGLLGGCGDWPDDAPFIVLVVTSESGVPRVLDSASMSGVPDILSWAAALPLGLTPLPESL